MVNLQIQVDEDTGRVLAELAGNYEGDFGRALADLVHAYESIEDFADEAESINQSALSAQLVHADRGFREGRSTNWDEVKRRNRL
jgi:hypothetical protein